MPKKNWYVYSQGASFGPLETSVVLLMLKQNRLSPVEFIWSEGMTVWERVRDMKEFGGEDLPPYPQVPIPPEQSEDAGEGAQEEVEQEEVEQEEVAQETEPEPVVKAVPKPVVKAKPVIKAVPKPEAEPAPAPSASSGATKFLSKLVPGSAKAAPAAQEPAPVVAKPKLAVAKPASAALPPQKPGALRAKMLAKKAAGVKAKPYVTIRRFERVSIDATLKANGYGVMKVMNLSEGGVLLKADKEVSVGTNLKFKMTSKQLKKSPLMMTGVIVRSGFPKNKELAVEFTRVNPAHKRVLCEYVKSHTAAK